MSEGPTPPPRPAAPRPYRLEPAQGGRLPEIGTVLSAAFADFTDNIGGYALAMAAFMVVAFPAMLLLVMVLYFAMFVVMFGGMMVLAVLAALAVKALGDAAGSVVMLIGMFVVIALVFLVVFGGIALGITALAPLSAGLNRMIADHQSGRARLDFGGVFGRIGQDVVAVVVVVAITSALTIGGSMLFMIPGLVAMYLTYWAPLLVMRHRMGPIAALKRSAGLAIARPAWQVPAVLLLYGISMVANQVPVLGPAFVMGLQVRLYREVYGDGEAPAELAA